MIFELFQESVPASDGEGITSKMKYRRTSGRNIFCRISDFYRCSSA
ncbi:hypothetical protein HMPREF9555_00840 [Selenomonas artemidis F0399]|uniref:Uncharacterized protein n=1 Tax=Selenomonas artemidis F0399 TaxID=749551 RepID=E7N1I7_9FIRM|nr:hypothetical protein HMPREF9555_00840 [Selenomonas artemidis F0399]